MESVILTHSPSVAGTIRRLFRTIKPRRKIRVIGSYDNFSHGPLPQHCKSRDFFQDRHAYWKSFDLYDVDHMQDFDLQDEYATMVKAIKSARNTEIWIADKVQDMFYAVVISHLLTEDDVDTSCMSIRFFGGEQVKWGLGAANLTELDVLFRSSTADQLDPNLFRDAWKAISQGSGEAIKHFIEEHDPSLPMVRAFSAYLLRFPDFNGGLGSIERALLGAGTDDMQKSAYTIGNAMAKGEPSADLIGDVILFRRLIDLCGVSPDPWFRMEGDPGRMWTCSAQITESGKDARVRYSVRAL